MVKVVTMTGTVVILVLFIVIVRIKNLIRGEGFRKLLHFVCLILLAMWVYAFADWKVSAVVMTLFILVAFPAFRFLEKQKGFEKFLAARKKGELGSSLVLTGVMFIIVTIVCEGIFDSKMLVITSIYAWGPGDATAALVGKRFGRHRIGKEKKKSVEGTAAMFLTSFVCVCVLLSMEAGALTASFLPVAVMTGIVAALTEFVSKNGNDTIICPLASMTALIAMLYLTGNLSLPV